MLKNRLTIFLIALLLCLSSASCSDQPAFEHVSQEQAVLSQASSQQADSSEQEISSQQISSLLQNSSSESSSQPSSVLQSQPSSSSQSVQGGTSAPSSAVSSIPQTPQQTLQLSATNAFVYDTKRDILFQKGKMNTRIYPASITKLYTAYVALQYLDPAVVVQAGEELTMLAYDSSVASIQQGNRLTVEMLIQGMLLPSGNDAAYVLAAAAGRAILKQDDCDAKQAVAAFVNIMNRHAQADGLTGTKFANPDGYHHAGHYSCMQDLLVIAKLALKTQLITKYSGQASAQVTFESGETRSWKNTNALLHTQSEYYRSSVIGLKTGFTNEAGHCLLSACVRGDSLVIAGVFRSTSSQNRFLDSVTLLDAYAQLAEEYDKNQTASKAA